MTVFSLLQNLAVKTKKDHAQEPLKRPACGLTPLLGLLGVVFFLQEFAKFRKIAKIDAKSESMLYPYFW